MTKLIPSMLYPLTKWYIVPLDGPDRVVEYPMVEYPMVEHDPLNDAYWLLRRGKPRQGPFDTAEDARAANDA